MTTLATNLFFAYVLFSFFSYLPILFNKKKREEHIEKHQQIDMLRNKRNKTLEEQKKFIDLKYPKKDFVSFNPLKWNYKKVFLFILRLIFFMSIFLTLRWLWDLYIVWQIKLWQVFLIAIIMPIIINFILKKFGIKFDDFTVFF